MTDDAIEELLAGYPAGIRGLALEVVAAIHAAMPEATATVARGWRSVNFRHPSAGYVCGVFPYADRVDVAFEAGSRLSDPDGVLEAGSTGAKRVRYVRHRPGDEVDAAGLEAFVLESIALSGRR